MKIRNRPLRWPAIAASLVFGAAGCANAPTTSNQQAGREATVQMDPTIGFVVITPDRGFLGNEEIRDTFARLADHNNAALVFVADERTRDTLRDALSELKARGATRVVALPLFISSAHPRWALASRLLDELAPPDLTIARRFGSSYLAVELLANHFRKIKKPAGRRVVVVGYGAGNELERQQMLDQQTVIAKEAASGFGFESVRVVVWHDYSADLYEDLAAESRAALQRAVSEGERPIVVPFHTGMKLDGMMSFNGLLRREIKHDFEILDVDITPQPEVNLWLQREVNRHTLSEQDIGVVILAHGADFFWNETMRRALQSVTERYPTEFAFSMADKTVVERAVRRLEKRGVRGIVIVRIFGMESSFRATIERMTGLDVEQGTVDTGSRQRMPGMPPVPRIQSAAVITTIGGLEDHPLFAKALADRAQELSENPASETVILVAHGLGDDAGNDHWLNVLESLAEQIHASGGQDYRAIHVATWREDWPEKHEPWLAKVRAQVQAATENNGHALVIPARTNARGSEQEMLDGLDFELGEGFAPHPLFASWVEDQVRQGKDRLLSSTGIEVVASKAPD